MIPDGVARAACEKRLLSKPEALEVAGPLPRPQLPPARHLRPSSPRRIGLGREPALKLAHGVNHPPPSRPTPLDLGVHPHNLLERIAKLNDKIGISATIKVHTAMLRRATLRPLARSQESGGNHSLPSESYWQKLPTHACHPKRAAVH